MEEQREWEDQMKAAGGVLRSLESLEILDIETVTIDFDKVEKEVSEANGDVRLAGHHYLYSLCANVYIKPLKELRDFLDHALKGGEEVSNKDISDRFKEDLFKILENWAKSESGLIYPQGRGVKYGKFGLYDAYKKILGLPDSDKARYEFVKYCAEVGKLDQNGLKTSSEWNFNHAEKIVAIVLLDIMDGKEPAEIAASLKHASDNYLEASEIQVHKDISREGFLLNLDGEKLIVNSMELLTQKFFRELNPIQLDFARLICDQGKSIGAFPEIVPLALAAKTKSPCQTMTSVCGKVACLIKEKDNIYVILTGVYRRALDKKGYPTIERVYDPENPELGGGDI